MSTRSERKFGGGRIAQKSRERARPYSGRLELKAPETDGRIFSRSGVCLIFNF